MADLKFCGQAIKSSFSHQNWELTLPSEMKLEPETSVTSGEVTMLH